MDNVISIITEKAQLLPGYAITYAPRILLALAIYIIGKWIVGKLKKATETNTKRLPNFDETLSRFIVSIVGFVGIALVIIAALAAMKINLAGLLVIVTGLVAAIGFALKDTVGDLASGVMLAFFRPFNIGDVVEVAGEMGTVTDLGIFTTTLQTNDNIRISVGNGAAFGSTIKNFDGFGDRRLDMDFGVSYDADLDKAEAAIMSVAKGDDRIYTDPAPWAKVTSLGDSAVNIQLRIWCKSTDYLAVQADISQRVKSALDKAGIDIPYEHCMIIEG